MSGLRRSAAVLSLVAGLFVPAWPATAIDIQDVLPGALDQPRINLYLTTRADGPPLMADGFFGPTFNIEAYYDTGASGIILSDTTATQLGSPINNPPEVGVASSHYPDAPNPLGPLVVFQDVGVGGSDSFNVSRPLYLGLAKFHPEADLDNPLTYSTVYHETFGPVRVQIAAPAADPLLEFDLVGTPGMAGKVVVMDPKPVDTILDTMRTYVYDPRKPFNAAAADSEPGIPPTNRHLRLSYAAMDRFTQVTPAGAPGPTMRSNPFLGPNPAARLDGATTDTTPGVTISFGGRQTTGSFLFDTGASVSMISPQQAERLHVRYVPGTEGTAQPRLEQFDPAHPDLPGTPIADQFEMPVGGVGGTVNAAGFYLDSMLLRTMEGDPGNDQDPNHLRFVKAPVLVSEITVRDPVTQQSLTLDGVFGVNNWVASADIAGPGNISTGNFNWVVFDEPNGVLGLDVKGPVPTRFSVWNSDGSAGANWRSAANWETGTPSPGDGLRFTAPPGTTPANLNDFDDGTRFSGIVFSGPSAFNLQGHRVALWGNVINISPATQTISLDLELGGADSTFNADSGDIVVQGRISGDQGIKKTGNYALILTGSNTYTGSTTIAAGALIAKYIRGSALSVGESTEAVIAATATPNMPASTSRVASLSIAGGAAPTGTLDLNNNSLIIEYTGAVGAILSDVTAQIRSGRDGKDRNDQANWTGKGIITTAGRTANQSALVDRYNIGAINNADLDLAGIGPHLPTFGGQVVTPNTVLVKYTYSGDANLDGVVNGDDYTYWLNGFLGSTNPAVQGWLRGDFNYDGVVDGDDYTQWLNSFLFAGPPLGGEMSPVPEPATTALLAAGALGLYAWRRRKSSMSRPARPSAA